ncbi:glycosyltransferase family 4 protein [Ornithinimicrobium panacihumi]|uniref:glycosyltransferase family 4 protein n=1 Tax=Ornithinimicrobium panacihumi TaxID=2008449 RepID=UPI003F8B6464
MTERTTSPRTVAYVCADPGIPVFGTKGASVHIQEIVRAWRNRGAHVEVFAVRAGDAVPEDLADLPVHVVKVGGKGMEPAQREQAQRAAAARLAELVVELGPDLVYERYSLFSDVLATAAEALSVPGVLEVNAPLIDEQRTHRVLVDETGADEILRDQLAAADVVACVSEPVAAWVRARVPAAADPQVTVVPNGVNTDRVRPVSPDPSGDPVVVFVGTLKPWHGVEDLLEARRLAQAPWRLRLIGDGPQLGAIEALVAEHDLDVDLVGAVVPEAVPAALDGAMVAVAPYPESGDHYFSPLKVYEYAAAALPVVASRIGQIPAVVEEGVTGLLVPPSDPAALAAAIDALVTDPARSADLGAAARRRMVEHHSWDQVLEATVCGIATHAPDAPAGVR